VITLKTFGTHVFIISAEGMSKAENCSTSRCNKYTAPSDSVLVEITDTRLRLVVGKQIPPKVYKHILGMAMSQKKRLELIECENLKNLRAIDDLITLYNKEYSLYI
jgi:hypothetical protein